MAEQGKDKKDLLDALLQDFGVVSLKGGKKQTFRVSWHGLAWH
jgi:hypothetical protein